MVVNLSAKTISEVHILSMFLEKAISCASWFQKKDDKFYLMVCCKSVTDDSRFNVMLTINNVLSVFKKGDFSCLFLSLLAVVCVSNKRIGFIFHDCKEIFVDVKNIEVYFTQVTDHY